MTPRRPRALPRPLLLLVVLLGALGGGCRGCGGGTVSVQGVLELSPATVVFPLRSVGTQPTQTVTARNLGRAPLTVLWGELEPPFSAEGLPTVLPPGEQTFTVRFRPTTPGHFTATLEASAEGEAPVTLTLQADARAVPTCPDPGACRAVRYDVEAEACLTDVLPDDTSCTEDTKCLLDAVCRAGTCVGRPRACDDGNACTLDTCNPLVGCEFFPKPPCPGDGMCGRGVCDPRVGCRVEPVPDGTLCGDARDVTCDSADVCISGTCQRGLDPLDGFVCAEASPCQEQGVCVAHVCQRDPAAPLALDFAFDARPLQDDPGAPTLHDFWMDEAGEMSLAGWPNGVPVLNATSSRPVDATGQARRCLLWDGRPVCGDFPGEDALGRPEAGMVSLLDASTGSARWTYRLRQDRPDLAQSFSSSPTLLFVTRIATLGSDRLMVLYEGYPNDVIPSQEEGRRRYLLAVLDAQGGLVAATPLSDPLLERSDHPHPFGVAADALGNGFIAFSPVAFDPDRDGLTAGSPTLLLSFTRDGQLRWKRTFPFVGGELAVGSGMLLPERAGQAYSTIDGEPAGTLPGPGRVGIAPGRVVLPPAQEGSRTLAAVAAPSLAPAWTYALPGSLAFSSRRLALARWRPRAQVDRTVVLGVAQTLAPLAQVSSLVAVEVEGGREAFVCPLQEPDPGRELLGSVQRLHVAGGRLGLMDRANRVGEDPPFAYGQARFTRYGVPGLTDAPVAWSGEFGGPDHDQQEEPPQPGPTP